MQKIAGAPLVQL